VKAKVCAPPSKVNEKLQFVEKLWLADESLELRVREPS
jgi:hypothetical protein